MNSSLTNISSHHENAELFRALTSPQKVAFFGASDDPSRIGGRPLAYTLRSKFSGELLPINPRRSTVQGLKAYSSAEDINTAIDLAIITVPAPFVAESVRQVANKGARVAVIFAAGFAEVGEQGLHMQQELIQISRSTGIRLVGPNCLGIINARNGLMGTFGGAALLPNDNPGGFTLISQSGAYGAHSYVAALKHGARPGMLLSTGNEADLGVPDFIQMAVDDPLTHVIGCYAEGISDGPKLIGALEAAREARKPVLFMKVGRSDVGATAAASHSASLAGEDNVFDAVLAQTGAQRMSSTEHMVDVAKAAIPRIYPAGRRLGIFTISGGGGVLMADTAEDEGLEVPPLPEAVQEQLKHLNPMASPRNPVDVTAHILNDPSSIEPTIRAMFNEGAYDAIIAYWSTISLTPEKLKKCIAEVDKGLAGQASHLLFHDVNPANVLEEIIGDGHFPVFEDPTRAVHAMATLMRFGEAFNQTTTKWHDRQANLSSKVSLPIGSISEREAKNILAEAGVPMVQDRFAKTPKEARKAAEELGGVLALKIVSPDIVHKSDVGGVALNTSPEQVEEVSRSLIEVVSHKAPNATIEGILLSPMIEDGVDCILGSRLDPVFGPVVVFGLGGIFTEVIEDVAFRLAPVTQKEAKEMIKSLKGAPLLKGARGQPPANEGALVDAIVAFSQLIATAGNQLESAEINPLRALPSGVLGLDAVIQLKP
ncbi:acetate--CoA ligase family protein [Flexibacterium corallicola]|uniref:acetate--CoA ligase family protein n=1 Tax=Flexibacterium corallicola TaxID=3037259 RepID=UPI00286F07BF|nr:acetate--CoA ligase family protein [Pseudovibrio sp. M1P-2-3]